MPQFDIRQVLAATDLSDSSLQALRYARLFAARFAARLTVLYCDPITFPLELAEESSYLTLVSSPEHEARLRREVEDRVGPLLGGHPYEIAVVSGQPAPAILRAAAERQADLIVIGTHSRRGWRRAILGSVSEGVLHGSRCPVLVVGGQFAPDAGAEPALAKIVCPVNFTVVSRLSLRFATALAEALTADLTVLHVVERGELTDPADEEARFHLWLMPETDEGISYREVSLRGGAAERVLDYAEDGEADLLVIGAQHTLFRDATVIGATTERLIRFAPCPVLVVPRQAAGAAQAEPRVPAAELQPA
jgi:nucleotide-binding universal stress UspA family protein